MSGLDISLVELIRGERQMSDQMTVSDAGAVVSQAMAQIGRAHV